jgi:hypothetical protein
LLLLGKCIVALLLLLMRTTRERDEDVGGRSPWRGGGRAVVEVRRGDDEHVAHNDW